MPHRPVITVDYPAPDIARLTFDDPDHSVNLLSRPVLDEFAACLDALAERIDLAGILIASGKPKTFLAGADLRDLAKRWPTLTAEQAVAASQRGHEVFSRLAKSRATTTALIDGVCLGGGAELASWCDARIVSDQPHVEIGFPEVQLGILPGWGGTVRLPRLIGLGPAIEWITGGQPCDGASARRAGWADDLVPSESLVATAIQRIRDAGDATANPMRRRAERLDPLPLSDDEIGLVQLAASNALRSTVHEELRAPWIALEQLLAAARQPAAAGLALESQRLGELITSPVVGALINAFLLRERGRGARTDAAMSEATSAAASVASFSSVGVIGAGIMGSGIAAAHVKRDVPTLLSDASPESLARGLNAVLEEVAYDRRTKKPDPQRALRAAALLHTVPDVDELARCELIIEAIVESAEAKRVLFERLEPRVSPQTILASNTSTIPITKQAAKLQRPERFCGMHYFNPVRRMQLVEVIRGEQTSAATVAAVAAHARRIGKIPIIVRDGPGFLVNRLLFPYMNEAIELLSDGAEPAAVEQAARQFGMPVGPLELYDMVGLDTAMYAGRVIWEAFPTRVRPLPVIPAMIKSGRLGHKSGRGFYSYDGKKRSDKPDATLQPLLDTYRTGQRSFTTAELIQRLFLPMLLEAARVLEDRIVDDARDVDFGLIFGLGFPSFRGGLLYWADRVGAAELLRQVESLAPLGVRFEPTKLLRSLAASGGTFYGTSFAQPAAAAGGGRA